MEEIQGSSKQYQQTHHTGNECHDACHFRASMVFPERFGQYRILFAKILEPVIGRLEGFFQVIGGIAFFQKSIDKV